MFKLLQVPGSIRKQAHRNRVHGERQLGWRMRQCESKDLYFKLKKHLNFSILHSKHECSIYISSEPSEPVLTDQFYFINRVCKMASWESILLSEMVKSEKNSKENVPFFNQKSCASKISIGSINRDSVSISLHVG